MDAARQQQARALLQQAAQPRVTSLSASWQPLGPNQIATAAYGNVTGRITAIAIDPADPTGNTVYLGTTGGGVWKSTNAAGPAAQRHLHPAHRHPPRLQRQRRHRRHPLAQHRSHQRQLRRHPRRHRRPQRRHRLLLRRRHPALHRRRPHLDPHPELAGRRHRQPLLLRPRLLRLRMEHHHTQPRRRRRLASRRRHPRQRPDLTNSVMGLYYSTDSGVTWQLATIMDGSPDRTRPRNPAASTPEATPPPQSSGTPSASASTPPSATTATTSPPTASPGRASPTSPAPASPPPPAPPAPAQPAASPAPSFAEPSPSSPSPATPSPSPSTAPTPTRASGRINAPSPDQPAPAPSPSPPTYSSTPTRDRQRQHHHPASRLQPHPRRRPLRLRHDTLLYAGTIDLYRCSLAAGCALRNTTNALNGCAAPAMVAPAQHAIATLATSTQPLLYLGNDGGLWRSTDGVNQQSTPCSPDDATHFQNLNSGLGSLAEIVSFAQHPTDPATLLAGLGANGTAATSRLDTRSMAAALRRRGRHRRHRPRQPSALVRLHRSRSQHPPMHPRLQLHRRQLHRRADHRPHPNPSSDASLIDAPWLLDPPSPPT